MSGPSPSLRRRASDVDLTLATRRSAAGHDIGDTRDALTGVVDDARQAAELVTELERNFATLRRISEAQVVITVTDSPPVPIHRRRWAGVGLIAAALLSTFGLSATNRAAVADDDRTQLHGTEFTGTIVPSQRVAVNAPVSGTVHRVLVAVGDTVAAGQPLVEVDDQSVRAALDAATLELGSATDEALHWKRRIAVLDSSIDQINTSLAQSIGAVALAQRQAERVPGRQLRDSPERAQAALEQATSKLQRVQRLHGQGLVSEETLEEHAIAARIAQNDLDNAMQWQAAAAELQRAQEVQARQQIARSRADLQQQRSDYLGRHAEAAGRAEQTWQRVNAAQRALDDAVVKATTGGVIVEVLVDVGDRPSAGAPLLSIARLNELVVEVPVAASLVNVLKAGEEATVILPTVPTEQVTGRIASINPIPAPNMTHRVEVEFANASGRLLSGQPAQVIFR